MILTYLPLQTLHLDIPTILYLSLCLPLHLDIQQMQMLPKIVIFYLVQPSAAHYSVVGFEGQYPSDSVYTLHTAYSGICQLGPKLFPTLTTAAHLKAFNSIWIPQKCQTCLPFCLAVVSPVAQALGVSLL